MSYGLSGPMQGGGCPEGAQREPRPELHRWMISENSVAWRKLTFLPDKALEGFMETNAGWSRGEEMA